MVELVEMEPGKWRVKRPPLTPPRSDLCCPMVISDTTEPLEHVNGQFYTSKRAFRAVTRQLGLTEVGNEKFKPKLRATSSKDVKDQRRQAIRKALQAVK